ncbi:MAG: VOC family protein [Pseudomonadota bacterium]
MHGTFVWADLSTFRSDVTERFYSRVMGWVFSDGVAHVNGAATAMLYTMPEKFQAIGMPSFWMSYIAVDRVTEAIEAAQALGGKVELGPVAYEQGQIALIRDPLGAGFTVYEGPAIEASTAGPGASMGHALFVSDVSKVAPFYEALFGWSFGPSDAGVQSVTLAGKHLFHAHSIPDPNIRRKEEYWAVLFRAPSGQFAQTLAEEGGNVLASVTLPEGRATLATDPDGAAFFVLGGPAAKEPAAAVPWRAWAGLIMVLVLSFSQMVWPWAIFLAAWIFDGLRRKRTYLFEDVSRSSQPLTYWAIMGSYGLLFCHVVLLTLSAGAI